MLGVAQPQPIVQRPPRGGPLVWATVLALAVAGYGIGLASGRSELLLAAGLVVAVPLVFAWRLEAGVLLLVLVRPSLDLFADRALAAAAAGAVDLPLPVVRRDRGDRGVGGGRDRPGRDRVDAPVRGAGHLRAGLPGGQQPGGGGAAACGDRGVGGGACGGRHRAVGDQLDPVDRRPPPRQRHVPAARSLRHLPGGGDGGGAGAGVRCPRPVAVAGAGLGGDDRDGPGAVV